MIAGVPAALRACKGDATKELAVFQGAFARWCELQAARGSDTPGAYFTHAFIGAKWGKIDQPTLTRWMELAVEAASP